MGLPDKLDAIVGIKTDRGYTEHEHLDEVGIIHMNGRIYDPLIGRFMSADPYIQAPTNLKTFNRYSYVWNNPLKFYDPDGFRANDSYQTNIGEDAVPGNDNSPPGHQVTYTYEAPNHTPPTGIALQTVNITGSWSNSATNQAVFTTIGSGQPFPDAGGNGSNVLLVGAVGAAGISTVSAPAVATGLAIAGTVVVVAYVAKELVKALNDILPKLWDKLSVALSVDGAKDVKPAEVPKTPEGGVDNTGRPPANPNSPPPDNAYNPDGPKAPGRPGEADGFEPPKDGDQWVKNPNGRGFGWLDSQGRVWVPTGPASQSSGDSHGGPHWDVQTGGRRPGYENIKPLR